LLLTLTDHINKYKEFNDSMKQFRDQIKIDLRAFLIIMPKVLEFTYWIGDHGHKPINERPNPRNIAPSVLTTCAKALDMHPTDSFVLALTYSNQGVANHLLGRYTAAKESFLTSLSHVPDNPNTLYNLACSTCRLGHLDEAMRYLGRVIIQQPERAQEALRDSDLASLRTDREFLQILGEPDQGKPDQGKPDQGKSGAEESGS
jgi:tetratricopeptide (TPR) repeat protein